MTSPLPQPDDVVQITPANDGHCRDLLEPWVIKSMTDTDPEWRQIVSRDLWHWRRKLAKNWVKGALSGNVARGNWFRTADHVRRTYGQTWSEQDWPTADLPGGIGKPTMAEWRGEGLVLKKGGLNLMQLERLMAVIEATKPRRVLEVGAGSGQNLLCQAGAFPETSFSGIELTEEGVARARSVQEHDELPDVIRNFSPFPIVDSTAHRRIDFQQGDATALPFGDGSFDLVYSRLALEQMERVRKKAVAEIVRVSSANVLMVEPFADFNDDPHRRLAHKSKNYFSMRLSELPGAGLEPLVTFSDWPQKISEGVVLVYCRKTAAG